MLNPYSEGVIYSGAKPLAFVSESLLIQVSAKNDRTGCTKQDLTLCAHFICLDFAFIAANLLLHCVSPDSLSSRTQ